MSESEYQYKEVLDGIEIQSISMNNENKGIYVIPSVIHGKTVVGIAKDAFYNKKDVVEVRLPNTLKYIGSMLFGAVRGWNISNSLIHLKYLKITAFLEQD